MAVSAFIMCFTILLKAGCSQTKPTAMVSSHYVATLTEYADVSTCEWNCVISNKDFSKEMKKLVTERKMVTLDVKYDEKVGERCLDQNDAKTLSKPELWIWLAAARNSEANQSSGGYSSSTSAPKLFADNMSLKDSQEGYKQINVSCDFEPTTRDARSNASGSFDNRLIALLLIEGIANSSRDLHLGSLCYAKTKHNPYICLNISKTGKNSETELDFGHKMFHFAFFFTFYLISVVFGLYSPAILCLFPVTEVTDRHGVCQVILEGPGPVGLRNLVAKYIHIDNDSIWRKVVHCMLRLAVFPLLLLIPSGGPLIKLDAQPIMSYISYGIRAFCLSFLPTKSFRNKSCLVCRFVRPEARFHRNEILKEIRDHLSVQTLLFQSCRKLFTRSLFRYVKLTSLVLPSFKASVFDLFQGLIFIGFVSTIPLVTMILIIGSILVFTFAVLATTPTSSIASVKWFLPYMIPKNKSAFYLIIMVPFTFLIEGCFIIQSFFGGFLLFGIASFNVGIASLYATVKFVKYSTESLPYVACFVIVLYYLWSCYSSFTNKYRVLSLKLFKQHKRICNQIQQPQDLECEIEPTHYNTEKIMRIPKDLFDIACEELMPIRQSVYIMMLKVVCILVFFFLVFSTIMAVSDATSTSKAMVTFFTGSFPKVLSIFLDGDRNKSLNDVALEEKVSCIVKGYHDITRSSTLDPVDDEEELIFTNPDTAELITLV